MIWECHIWDSYRWLHDVLLNPRCVGYIDSLVSMCAPVSPETPRELVINKIISPFPLTRVGTLKILPWVSIVGLGLGQLWALRWAGHVTKTFRSISPESNHPLDSNLPQVLDQCDTSEESDSIRCTTTLAHPSPISSAPPALRFLRQVERADP